MAMNKFGITGGIGSGKTYISHLLEKNGFSIFNCDEAARRLMLGDTSLQEELSSLIGAAVLKADGQLDKQLIGNFLFSSPEHVKAVNALVHPRVRQAFGDWALEKETAIGGVVGETDALPRHWLGMECSILFESGFDDLVDFTISVYAPEAVRLQRVEQRDGLTARQVKARIAQQLPEEEKLKRSDFIFTNDGSSSVESQLLRLESALKERL